MCLPVLAPAIAAAGLGLSIYGESQQASAQKKAAQAIATQNTADQAAQNQGFTQRLAATGAQTAAQKQAFSETLGNEQQIADAMRARQQTAFGQQQDTLSAMNQQEANLRSTGYSAADDLLGQTSGGNLAQAQSDWQTQAANLLDTSGVSAFNPPATGGTGDDSAVNAALSRRAAEAATNIRAYGSKAAKLGSYAAPLDLVQNAITDNQTGIMPAAMASKLLQSSSPVLLQPSQVAWNNAQNLGAQGFAAAQQSGQAAQNIANLQYQNSTDLANLQQQDTTTTAANIAEQAEADAAFRAAMGGVISGIGNKAAYGGAYYGTVPGFLKPVTTPSPVIS